MWTLAAAASAEVVRLGYFGEAQPFQVACARGWFDIPANDDDPDGVQVVCLPQASGGFAVAKALATASLSSDTWYFPSSTSLIILVAVAFGATGVFFFPLP